MPEPSVNVSRALAILHDSDWDVVVACVRKDVERRMRDVGDRVFGADDIVQEALEKLLRGERTWTLEVDGATRHAWRRALHEVLSSASRSVLWNWRTARPNRLERSARKEDPEVSEFPAAFRETPVMDAARKDGCNAFDIALIGIAYELGETRGQYSQKDLAYYLTKTGEFGVVSRHQVSYSSKKLKLLADDPTTNLHLACRGEGSLQSPA